MKTEGQGKGGYVETCRHDISSGPWEKPLQDLRPAEKMLT